MVTYFLLIKNEEFFFRNFNLKIICRSQIQCQNARIKRFDSYLSEVKNSINEHLVYHKTMTLQLMFD
jgi:hypothetical protein